MKIVGATLAIAAIFLSLLPGSVRAANSQVVDVSWPNCSLKPAPSYKWGIVGVTGGLDFRPNPCLAKEAGRIANYALYVNTGYPGATAAKQFSASPRSCSLKGNRCLAYNYGYNATLYAVKYADSQLVASTSWWLDVETENSWTTSQANNKASLEGAIDALKQQTFLSAVGIYSTPYPWVVITGNWQNHLPSWIGTGSRSLTAAKAACKVQSFTGESPWLAQYSPSLDIDDPCSGQFMYSLNKLQPSPRNSWLVRQLIN